MMIGVIPPRAIHSGSDRSVFRLVRFFPFLVFFFGNFLPFLVLFFSISLSFLVLFFTFGFRRMS